MKDIKESIQEVQNIVEFLQDQAKNPVNEGLKDVLNNLKNKFKKVVQYLRGLVAKFGSYWLAVGDDGEVLSAISPLTAAQAYADGNIDKSSTLVWTGREGSRLTGCKSKPEDALNLYGSGNSIKYWKRMVKESLEKNPNMINEVKLANTDPQAKYNVVDTAQLKKYIKVRVKNPSLTRLMVWGAPGIGKTAILQSVLDELPNSSDYTLITKSLSNETPDNFTLPKYVEVETEVDGKIERQDKAADVPKTWLPVYKPTGDPAKDKKLSDACGKGLLFIDELSRATPQVMNVVLPLINEGEFNGYKVGDGWTIIAASNRMEDDESSQTEIGNALGNRFMQVYYEPTIKSWKQWAEKQNFISPLLLQWLSLPESESMSGGKYFYFDPNEEGGNDITKIMCTPRSWTNAMRELACYSETGDLEGWTIFDLYREDPTILKATLNGYVPAEAVDGFISFLEVLGKVGDFEQFCEAVWHNDGKGANIEKRSITAVAIPICQLLVTYHGASYPTSEEFNSLANWVVNQNSDQLASFIIDTIISVYGEGLPQKVRQIMFASGQWLATRGKDAQQVKLMDSYLQGWYRNINSKFGLNVQSIKDLPDWSEGFGVIAKKYAAAFAAAKVDGLDALD